MKSAEATRLLPLDAIAVVRGGYAGSDAVTTEPGIGRFRALQSRDIASDGTIDWNSLGYSQPVRDGERYAIGDGDVLFPLRAARPRALVVRGAPANVIAAGQWALITPHASVAESDYLAWFLNHPATAARLSRVFQRGTLPFLSLSSMRGFEISVPPLRTQRRISDVSSLHARLILLERQVADARTRLIDAITMESLHNRATPTDEHQA
jgi:hypothetical protein